MIGSVIGFDRILKSVIGVFEQFQFCTRCHPIGFRQIFLPCDELAKVFKSSVHVRTMLPQMAADPRSTTSDALLQGGQASVYAWVLFLQTSDWHAKLYSTSHPKPRKDGAVFVKWVPGRDPLHKHF